MSRSFSFRLQQLTSLQVYRNPEGEDYSDPGKVLELTNPELFNYPFIYMLEPGDLMFSDEEVDSLRH